MFLENFEGFGVTADSKKVLPGMVYVDLHHNKDRKALYHAYQNGASLIFTTQNISDPELPVIKVNNVYDTMMILLNKHFQSPQEKVKLIAVSGSHDKESVADLLYKTLNQDHLLLKSNLEYYKEYASLLHKMTIEDIYEHLNKIAHSGMHFTPIIADYKMKYFRFINGFKFDSAIITGVHSIDAADKKDVTSSIKSFASQLPNSRPIIVNNDDDLVLQALEACKGTMVITFGLNKKAAVTATSINMDQQVTFNYCLQRSFTTSSGNVLEPFEMPITINMLGNQSIYNALAVITCALYYDVDLGHIKRTLAGYEAPNRRYELDAAADINILDHYCCNEGELDKTFELLQTLHYSDLFVLLSINKSEGWAGIDSLRKVFEEWKSMLGISEVVFCGATDTVEEVEPLSINDIRKLKKSFSDLCTVKYIETLEEASMYIAAKAKQGDMLLLAGGDELNHAKKFIKQHLNKLNQTSNKNKLH